MSIGERSCRICDHWRSTGGGWGECRRYPPRLLSGEGHRESAWPTTIPSDRCGEFALSMVERDARRTASLDEMANRRAQALLGLTPSTAK
jgi:hypothetical protein